MIRAQQTTNYGLTGSAAATTTRTNTKTLYFNGCIEEKINEIKKAKLPTKEQKPDTKVVKDAVLQDDCGIFLQLLCEKNANELVFCWKQ